MELGNLRKRKGFVSMICWMKQSRMLRRLQ